MKELDLLALFERGQGHPSDDALFVESVRAILAFKGIGRRTLAKRFGTSLPTIKRWVEGTSTPHPPLRFQIYAAFIEMVMGVETPTKSHDTKGKER